MQQQPNMLKLIREFIESLELRFLSQKKAKFVGEQHRAQELVFSSAQLYVRGKAIQEEPSIDNL